MRTLHKSLTALLLLAASCVSALAGTSGSVGGTSLPPATTITGIVFTPFGTDSSPLGSITNSLPTPVGGNLLFSGSFMHQQIGSGWATWSNGYTGSVYSDYSTSSLVLTLPSFTTAFYFYAEPNDFGLHTVFADADGVFLSQDILGNSGASLFTFWTDGTSYLSTINISVGPEAQGFGIGQFGIAREPGAITPVPEPSTYGLMGAAALAGLGVWRRRRQKKAA